MSQILHCGDAANDLQSIEQSYGVLLPTMNSSLVGEQDAAVAASGNRIGRRTVYRAFRGGIFAIPRRRVTISQVGILESLQAQHSKIMKRVSKISLLCWHCPR